MCAPAGPQPLQLCQLVPLRSILHSCFQLGTADQHWGRAQEGGKVVLYEKVRSDSNTSPTIVFQTPWRPRPLDMFPFLELPKLLFTRIYCLGLLSFLAHLQGFPWDKALPCTKDHRAKFSLKKKKACWGFSSSNNCCLWTNIDFWWELFHEWPPLGETVTGH